MFADCRREVAVRRWIPPTPCRYRLAMGPSFEPLMAASMAAAQLFSKAVEYPY